MDPAVRTEAFSKRYGATLALDALDLTVAPGEVYGLVAVAFGDGRRRAPGVTTDPQHFACRDRAAG